MKKIFLSLIIFIFLTIAIFTLTGCTLKIETNQNSVSASVDEETQSTFERIVDWIVDKLDRIFVTENKNGGNA